MNFLMLIPGIFSLLEKIIGPLIFSQKSSISSGVISAIMSGQGLEGILKAIQGVTGTIENAKLEELKIQLDSLLAQCKINEIEAASDSRFKSWWRPFLCWGLGINIVAHSTIITLIDILQLFGYNPPTLTPLDTITLTLMSGVLGLGIATRTIEKYTDTTGN